MKKITSLFSLLFLFSLAKAQILDSTNLPIITINTNGQEIVDDPKIMADMGIIWNDNNATNHINDTLNHYNGKIGIEIRGQSSQMFPMKSYGLELWNNSGNSINKPLFGLQSESDWILYAPYNEKTLQHNFLAYTISREMGHWAANCRYVELLINGEYRGIYVFMEKIKRKGGRVNISSMSSNDNSGDAVTGGYIFSIDKDADAWYSTYPAGLGTIHFGYVYPKIANITTQQQDYIHAYTDSFENSLHTSNFQDTVSGWRKFADENSFIDYFLVNEVSHNVDGYRISSFFNKDRYSINGKIKAGPVWDYDLAFRNADYCDGSNTASWAYQFNSVCPSDSYQVPDWWSKFLSDSTFKDHLYCRWKELRNSTFSIPHLNYLIDSIATLTSQARVRHFQKWPVLGQYIWPNPSPIATTYEGEVQTLKGWLAERLDWLDKNIPHTGSCFVQPPIIIDTNLTFSIRVYPNPTAAAIQIFISSGKAQTINISATDMVGRKMLQTSINIIPGNNNIKLASENWAAAVYSLEFTTSSGERIIKRVVKRR